MKTLHHAVALGVVGSRHHLLDAHLLAKSGPNRAGELGSPVRGNLSWYTESRDPASNQGRRTAVGGGAGEGNRLRPPCAAIYNRKNVILPMF
jgi:hypothetical protein